MSFLTLTTDNLSSNDAAKAYQIFVSPAPNSASLPSVWVDLHVAETYYQHTEDTTQRRTFTKSKTATKKHIWIGAKRGVRLVTAERVGCDTKHTGIVMNVASRAKHGLIVAPGKIDPGFAPNRLVLVVFNQSSRRIQLWADDKIACVAFAQVEGECPATESHGHANGILKDFREPWRQRVVGWFSTRDYRGLAYDVLKLALAAGLALLVAWLTGYLGLKKS